MSETSCDPNQPLYGVFYHWRGVWITSFGPEDTIEAAICRLEELNHDWDEDLWLGLVRPAPEPNGQEGPRYTVLEWYQLTWKGWQWVIGDKVIEHPVEIETSTLENFQGR